MTFQFLLEMLGTAAFAASGALAASRKGMDVFGFIVLALMPAVGGGTLRDLLLDRHPVFWVANNSYVLVAVLVAVAVFLGVYRPGRRQQLLLWTDALGMALFAAIGTEVSLQYGAGPLVAVMLGVATAVTGGIIRDIMCAEIPLVLTREIYATAAFATSVVFVLADSAGLGRNPALVIATLIGFAFRGLAMTYDWTLPPPRVRK
ncbi:MAG TPA: trimeric intracellular cation channel family protein [Woeseiaceae bacterium]|nr:trimeric intracellular cation channel family protein [Woeseiaceae bacterium]